MPFDAVASLWLGVCIVCLGFSVKFIRLALYDLRATRSSLYPNPKLVNISAKGEVWSAAILSVAFGLFLLEGLLRLLLPGDFDWVTLLGIVALGTNVLRGLRNREFLLRRISSLKISSK